MDEPRSDAFSEPQVLGGNIELAGFKDLDGGSMVVLKKIIGNYARRFADQHGSEKLTLQLRKDAGVFALTGSLVRKGQTHTADHADKNVFFVVDAVLKKLEQQLTSS